MAVCACVRACARARACVCVRARVCVCLPVNCVCVYATTGALLLESDSEDEGAFMQWLQVGTSR